VRQHRVMSNMAMADSVGYVAVANLKRLRRPRPERNSTVSLAFERRLQDRFTARF
jgi:hypothetical protein